jgi:hypothetical protein
MVNLLCRDIYIILWYDSSHTSSDKTINLAVDTVLLNRLRISRQFIALK